MRHGMKESDRASESMGSALIRSTWSAGLSGIASEAADVALDQLVGSGVLKDIPLIGWFGKAHAAVRVVRDALLLKKILRFLEGAAEATEEDRQAFRRKMEEDPGEARRVGEQLLLHLDRHEHFDKSFYTGLVYAALVADRIDRETFDRLMASVDRLDAAQLRRLPQCYTSLSDVPEDVGQALLLAGLVGIYFTLHDLRVVNGPQPAGSGMFNYRENKLGRQLVEILEGHTA